MRKFATWALALLFVALLVWGLRAGQYATSRFRAVVLCTSCIGLE